VQFHCNTAWTEQLSQVPSLYTIGFGVRDYVPALGNGCGPGLKKDYEVGLYYAADLGRPEQSPYCLSRGGYAKFESWDVDTSATTLSYRLPYLDPRRSYKLCAVLYHEGDSAWDAQVRCDSGPWHHMRVAPNAPDTFWLQVPKALYKRDARIIAEVARVTGDYVSLARLKLFQIEEEKGEEGGVQSVDYGGSFVTRLRNCAPNPFAKATAISY